MLGNLLLIWKRNSILILFLFLKQVPNVQEEYADWISSVDYSVLSTKLSRRLSQQGKL